MAVSVCSLGRAVQLVAIAVRAVLRLLDMAYARVVPDRRLRRRERLGGAESAAKACHKAWSHVRVVTAPTKAGSKWARSVTPMTWRVTSGTAAGVSGKLRAKQRRGAPAAGTLRVRL